MLWKLFSVALAFGCAQANIQTRCTQRGMYAMTWDDGPAQYTEQLLNVLSSKNVKATFHITTKYLTDPNIQATIQRIASAGHLIGLRTESDWNLFQMNDDQIRAGIARQANVLGSFIGYIPKFIRLPYNGFDDRVLKAVESTGLIVTNFNLETYDYTNDGTRTYNAVKLALSLVGKGAGSFVSIQHDGVQQSVGITSKVIDLVKSSGYKFVKLDECMGLGDMTKNKEQLKGADDSIDLGSMGGGNMPNAGMAAGAPLDGNFPGDSSLEGQGSNSKNSAASSISNGSTLAAMIVIVMSLLFC